MICSSFVCHTVVLVMDLASASSVDHPSADDLLLWSSLADFFFLHTVLMIMARKLGSSNLVLFLAEGSKVCKCQ